MKDKWIYHEPVFEGDEYNETLLKYAPWSGLRRFAYDLVAFAEPEVIAELGSHYGCSAFAFLQAIKDKGLNTEFYAVDTWEGDSYTNYSDVENVYQMYSAIESEVFSGQNTHKLRMRFEDAVKSFGDGSIDILHIDGSHAYDDVRSDYETWFSKVKDDGLILLHDVGEDLVNGEMMGSHYFWNELKKSGAYTAELMFSCGLGIVAKNKEVLDRLTGSFSAEYYQNLNNIQDTVTKEAVRKSYFRIKDQEAYISGLISEKTVLEGHVKKYEEDTSEKALYISRLEDDLEKNRKAAEKQYKSQNRAFRKTIKEKEEYIRELGCQISELNSFAGAKDAYAAQLEKDISSIQDLLESKESYIAELEDQLSGMKDFSESKEEYCRELLGQISDINGLVADKENYIEELKRTILKYSSSEAEKNDYISELESEVKQLNAFAAGKDEYIKELTGQVGEINAFAESKEQYIGELLQQINDYNVFAEGKERYIHELEAKVSGLEAEIAGLQEELSKRKRFFHR